MNNTQTTQNNANLQPTGTTGQTSTLQQPSTNGSLQPQASALQTTLNQSVDQFNSTDASNQAIPLTSVTGTTIATAQAPVAGTNYLPYLGVGLIVVVLLAGICYGLLRKR